MSLKNPPRKKILYVGDLRFGGTCTHRLEAMLRIEQDVIPFNTEQFHSQSKLISALRFRHPVGPLVSRVNRELLKAFRAHRPEIVWFDKPLVFTPETVQTIKDAGAHTVCYNQDNPFGPRNDGCWTQFLRVFRLFDLNCLFRDIDVQRYKEWGLNYIKLQFGYDPAQNFPPPANWSDASRNREVSFIGSPYDHRAEFLIALAEKYRLPVSIAGPNWSRALSLDLLQKYVTAGALPPPEYRENIWRSKINLAFVTHSNEDDVAHKAFEIAACASFLLAKRTPGHMAAFEEDKEAVFFEDVEECASKCRFYLDHPEHRRAIAKRGYERVTRSGYDNDTQLKRALLKLAGEDTAISWPALRQS
jgi:spore maturation protein CgeB